MRALRLRSLSVSANDLGVAPSAEFPQVYGVLMEWPLGETSVTITSFVTGDASLYTTSGFGVIGGVDHERVRMVARRFVRVADRHYEEASSAGDHAYPAKGRVRFVLLGYGGRRTIDGDIPLPDGSGTVYDLFAAGQNVLTELRRVVDTAKR